MADPKTGVITAKALNISNIDILVNGSSILLFLKPDIVNILLVAKRLTNDIVVLIPAKYTPNINISCTPAPVNFNFDEKGVINVHPATV